MTRYASFIALAAFLTFGIGTALSFAGEPTPSEQKEKDMTSPKADEKKKDEKKDMERQVTPRGAQVSCVPLFLFQSPYSSHRLTGCMTVPAVFPVMLAVHLHHERISACPAFQLLENGDVLSLPSSIRSAPSLLVSLPIR